VVDAAVGVLYAQRWEAALRIDNALDEEYQITPPYTTSPRAFYLSLGAKF
jgi:outer membrane cobalamin receptor